MIEWWGPIINEYYAGSEGIGMTLIKAEDWLDHPGSVGKAIYGTLHVCDEDGTELPAGQDGLLFFENALIPTYHNDPGKTAEAMHPKGWMTLGDIGHLDKDGYLYLTDRKSHMIISGGVNIYPQEIENLLVTHDKVMDAAVIGAPCPDFGREGRGRRAAGRHGRCGQGRWTRAGGGIVRFSRAQAVQDQDAQAVRLPARTSPRS